MVHDPAVENHELAGIQDVLGKSLGSNNKLNVVKATFDALEQLRTWNEVKAIREAAE